MSLFRKAGDGMSTPLEDLLRLFDPATLQAVLTEAGRTMGATAESFVSSYPAQTHNSLPVQYTRTNKTGQEYRSKFKSIKQQHKVFALIRDGSIPYRRSGQLGRSITSDIESVSSAQVTVSIGTNLGYAPLVIGDPETEQAPYHFGNWTPLQQDMERNADAINEAGLNRVVQELGKRL